MENQKSIDYAEECLALVARFLRAASPRCTGPHGAGLVARLAQDAGASRQSSVIAMCVVSRPDVDLSGLHLAPIRADRDGAARDCFPQT